ncbi:hypothetical protein [Saccharothrix sp. HUAS TT1]|uniref:hypothetical protein n=1 Tax=unclassified Saccharothrix TaxID=2593673 RepID=UPI00345BC8C4
MRSPLRRIRDGEALLAEHGLHHVIPDFRRAARARLVIRWLAAVSLPVTIVLLVIEHFPR